MDPEELSGQNKSETAGPPLELHRSNEILVRTATGHGSRACIVTFDSFTDHRTLDRPGFAEPFLKHRGIDAVHVLSRENDWYQYPEMPEVLAAIRELTRSYKRVVAYGSSMGGYAAFRFADQLGANAYIALSPQFSIDPAVVPFEDRWHDASNRLAFLWDGLVPTRKCVGYVFYDPYDDDRRHFELIASASRAVGIRLPHAGHPAGGYLAELRLLQEAVVKIAEHRFNPREFERKARARRRRSAKYWMTLSHKTPPRRGRLKLQLAQKALELAPHDAEYMSQLAELFVKAERYEEAALMHDRAMAAGANYPIVRHRYAWFLTRIGRLDEAEEIAVALSQDAPTVTGFSEHLAFLRKRRNEEAEIEAARQAAMVRQAQAPQSSGWLIKASSLLARARALLSGRPVEALGDTLEARKRLTTTPAPPQFAAGWDRHLACRADAERSTADLVLIGDSLVEYWPAGSFAGRRVLNLGVAADRTQHVLWRLRACNLARLAPTHAVVMVGTNNLASGDEPDAIVAGLTAVNALLREIWPGVRVLTIEIPPCGPEFTFNARTRFLTNRLLRETLETLNVDREMTCDFELRSPNYHPDHIHFSEAGYAVLSRLVAARLAAPASPERGTRPAASSAKTGAAGVSGAAGQALPRKQPKPVTKRQPP